MSALGRRPTCLELDWSIKNDKHGTDCIKSHLRKSPCRGVDPYGTGDTPHISSADCLRKLNHALKVGQLYRSSDVGFTTILASLHFFRFRHYHKCPPQYF